MTQENAPDRISQPADSDIVVLPDAEKEWSYWFPARGLNRWTLLMLAIAVGLISFFWRDGAAFFEFVDAPRKQWVSHRSGVKMLGLGVGMLVLGVALCIGNYRIRLTPNEIVKQLRIFGVPLFSLRIPWNKVAALAAESSGRDPVIRIHRNNSESPVILEEFSSAEERDWLLAEMINYRAFQPNSGEGA